MRSFNLSTLKKEGREEPGRAMSAQRFKLPPERSPGQPAGKGRGTRSQRWESGIHRRYYCRTPHKSYGAYRAVVGTRGYYNKYGLTVLNPDPRPSHEAMRRVPVLEENAAERPHAAEFASTAHVAQESHWSCQQETPREHAASEPTDWRTEGAGHEIRHFVHESMAAEDPREPLPLAHIIICEARGEPLPAHTSEAVAERTERSPDPSQLHGHRMERSEPVSVIVPQPERSSERVECPQKPECRVSATRHSPERTAQSIIPEIRVYGATGRPLEVYSAPAARGADAPAVPVQEADYAPVPVYVSPLRGIMVRAPRPAVSQPMVPAAKMDTFAAGAVFVESWDATQSAPAPIQTASPCPKPGALNSGATGVRSASEVYIAPKIRRNALRATVVGAEALPD